MEIQDRLQIVLKMHELTASAFADKIGVQRSNVSHVLSGRNKPGLEFLEKTLKAFPRVNALWLITGTMEGQNLQYPDLNSGSHKINDPELDYGVAKVNSKGKEIEKIVVFYKDFTFVEYKNV